MNKRITLRDIAGYCPEEAIWKMVIDLGQSIKDNGHCPLSPDGVMVDDKAFLTDDSADTQSQFLAPECTDGATKGQAQQIWSLGALVYFASSGRTLFGGYGGAYQKNHPNVLLPTLRKDHQSLTALVQQCLAFDPSSRIGIDRVMDEARKGYEQCRKAKRCPIGKTRGTMAATTRQKAENWPEEMQETI